MDAQEQLHMVNYEMDHHSNQDQEILINYKQVKNVFLFKTYFLKESPHVILEAILHCDPISL